MFFRITLMRCFLLAIAFLLLLAGLGMLLSLSGTRSHDIQRRKTLKEAQQLVENQRNQSGVLPHEVSLLADTGGGDIRQVEIWVSAWQPVNWRHARDIKSPSPPDPAARDFLLMYSNSSSDWMDILDSKTGRTSLDNTGIHNYLLFPTTTLGLAGGLFYIAKRLRQPTLRPEERV